MAKRPLETRQVTAAIELREDGVDAAPVLTGYASTFGQSYRVGFFDETIQRSAFDRTLSMTPDVVLLVDHAGQPLARTKSGTLNLSTDDHGLSVRAELDASDPDVQRLLPKMRRGDMDQMSFAFSVPDGGDAWDFGGERPQRSIREASLSGGDVSIVTHPANDGTAAQVRARDERESAATLIESMLREARSGRKFDDAAAEQMGNALALFGLANVRAADAAERLVRAVGDMSYNDREQALSDALLAKYAPSDDDNDAACDMWVVDASDTWVVWRQYGDMDPGIGLWRAEYTVDDGDAITFGDPAQVTAQTTYVPTAQQANAAAVDLSYARAVAEQARRRRHAA
jgi:HK97 family phage prohead protease